MAAGLRITGKDGNERVVPVQLSADEVALLRRFSTYAKDVFQCKWAQAGFPALLRLQWKQGQGFLAETNLPNWDDVVVFLHKMRPLHLESEDTYYCTVSNVI